MQAHLVLKSKPETTSVVKVLCQPFELRVAWAARSDRTLAFCGCCYCCRFFVFVFGPVTDYPVCSV